MARSEPIQPTAPSTPTTAMTRNRHRATATRRTTEARAPTRATPASLVATVVTDVGRSVIVVYLLVEQLNLQPHEAEPEHGIERERCAHERYHHTWLEDAAEHDDLGQAQP